MMQVGPPRWPLVVHFVAALALAPVVHPMAVMALAFVVHLVTTLGIILTPARRRDLGEDSSSSSSSQRTTLRGATPP